MKERLLIKKAIETQMPDLEAVRRTCLSQPVKDRRTGKSKTKYFVSAFSCALVAFALILMFPLNSENPRITVPEQGTVTIDRDLTASIYDGDEHKVDREQESAKDENTNNNLPDSQTDIPDNHIDTPDTSPDKPEPDGDNLDAAVPQMWMLIKDSCLNQVDGDMKELLGEELVSIDGIDAGAFNKIDSKLLGFTGYYIDVNIDSLTPTTIVNGRAILLELDYNYDVYYICCYYVENSKQYIVSKDMDENVFIDGIVLP